LYLTEPDVASAVEISNNGKGPLFARVIRTGVAVEGRETEAESNLKLSVTYKTMDGTAIDITNLQQGTNFVAEVSVTNPGLKGKFNELALTQIFPSGWEIINTRLDGSQGSIGSDVPEYMDIRDDRVMHYFDLEPNKKMTFRVLLNAAYQGRYYLPAVSANAMYDHSVYARKKGQWVEVIGESKAI
jgi:alpha-2-macroglobulin